MPQILCTLPNASNEISGVKFASNEKGMLSEEVSDDVAADFASIPGYVVVGAVDPEAAAAAKAAAEAEKVDLLARAAKIADFRVKANWSLDRLRAEVEGAEKAAAEAAAKGAEGTN